eukprot:932751-Amphidinium_carterae.1
MGASSVWLAIVYMYIMAQNPAQGAVAELTHHKKIFPPAFPVHQCKLLPQMQVVAITSSVVNRDIFLLRTSDRCLQLEGLFLGLVLEWKYTRGAGILSKSSGCRFRCD